MPGAPKRLWREGGDVAQQRLRTQRLTGSGFAAPADVVRWFGAVQAQDYYGALWAVGQRCANATAASVEHAIADRAIVRTWPLRGTLHFVAAEDVGWMMEHLAPRLAERTTRRFLPFGLDRRVFARCATTIVKALEGGRQLTRPKLYERLERAGIPTAGRGLHILWQMAHDGLICFGTREGKQHTFVLLEEWVPKATRLDRDEALAELARRYFTSHGPATLQDFTWWSGLAVADARSGVAMAGIDLGRTRRSAATEFTPRTAAPRTAHHAPHVVLLPPYDEYTVAYKDRSAALDPKHAAATRNGIFSPTIVIDGRIAGTWTSRPTASAVTISLQPLTRLTPVQSHAIAAAAARYGRFLGRPVRIV
jgi:Winged helix DNA-binding domain